MQRTSVDLSAIKQIFDKQTDQQFPLPRLSSWRREELQPLPLKGMSLFVLVYVPLDVALEEILPNELLLIPIYLCPQMMWALMSS